MMLNLSMLLGVVPSGAGGAALTPSIPGTLAMFVDTDPVYTDTGATVPATTQGDLIAAWKDSRTGVVMTQATSGKRFALRLDSACARRSMHILNGASGTTYGFTWPSGISINSRASTMWAVVRPTVVSSPGLCFFNPGASLTQCLIDCNDFGASTPIRGRLFGTTPGTNGDTTTNVPGDMVLVVSRQGASSVTLSVNDVDYTSTSAFAANTLSAGTMLGRQDGASCVKGEIFAMGIVDHALTAGEIADLRAWAYARYFGAAKTKRLVTNGDSRTEGQGTLLGKNWPCVVVDTLLPSGWSLFNQAISGSSCNQAVARLNSYALTFDATLTKNVYGHFHATNDIGGGRTAAQLIADTSTILTAMRAAGFLTAVATEVSRTGSTGWDVTKEGHKDTFNTAIRAGGSLASLVDVVVDLGADSLLNDPTNTTYHNVDKIHFTQAGSDRIASLFAAAIATL